MITIEPQELSLKNWPPFNKKVLLFQQTEKGVITKVGYLKKIDAYGFNFSYNISDQNMDFDPILDYKIDFCFEPTHFQEFQVNLYV